MVETQGDWLGCPSAVKEQLPKKIRQAVLYAMDECFTEVVGEPAAQRDQWLYKKIKSQICVAMKGWVEDAIDDALAEILEIDE